jgi:hypothetical protein
VLLSDDASAKPIFCRDIWACRLLNLSVYMYFIACTSVFADLRCVVNVSLATLVGLHSR